MRNDSQQILTGFERLFITDVLGQKTSPMSHQSHEKNNRSCNNRKHHER